MSTCVHPPTDRAHTHGPLCRSWTYAVLLAAVLGAISPALAVKSDSAGFTVQSAKAPIVVDVSVPHGLRAEDVAGSAADAYLEDVVSRLANASKTNAGRLVALRWIETDDADGQDWTLRSAIIERVFPEVRSRNDSVLLSVWGLPREGFSATSLSDREQNVHNLLDAFVSPRAFIIHNGGLNEVQLIRTSLAVALRLSNGRPVLVRTNGEWREIRLSHELADGEVLDPIQELRSRSRGSAGYTSTHRSGSTSLGSPRSGHSTTKQSPGSGGADSQPFPGAFSPSGPGSFGGGGGAGGRARGGGSGGGVAGVSGGSGGDGFGDGSEGGEPTSGSGGSGSHGSGSKKNGQNSGSGEATPEVPPHPFYVAYKWTKPHPPLLDDYPKFYFMPPRDLRADKSDKSLESNLNIASVEQLKKNGEDIPPGVPICPDYEIYTPSQLNPWDMDVAIEAYNTLFERLHEAFPENPIYLWGFNGVLVEQTRIWNWVDANGHHPLGDWIYSDLIDGFCTPTYTNKPSTAQKILDYTAKYANGRPIVAVVSDFKDLVPTTVVPTLHQHPDTVSIVYFRGMGPSPQHIKSVADSIAAKIAKVEGDK